MNTGNCNQQDDKDCTSYNLIHKKTTGGKVNYDMITRRRTIDLAVSGHYEIKQYTLLELRHDVEYVTAKFNGWPL